MSARRPNVPRAGRSSPRPEQPTRNTGEDQFAPGSNPGSSAARPAAAPTSFTGAVRPSSVHGTDPVSATDVHSHTRFATRAPAPRGAGPSATKDPRSSSAIGGRTARRSEHTTPVHGIPAARPRGSRPASAPEKRAAEREQLAGTIQRGRLGSRRVESPIRPAEEATPIPARTFSGRLLALAVVLIAVIVLLAPTVSRYVQQQAEVDTLRAEIAVQEQERAANQSELDRWDDPAFVRQQARERIFLVMPGETRYLVKGGTGIEDSTGEGSPAEPDDLPWVDSLWNSITRAATD
ncbi:septum formation initiator family protein [Arthrobacter echini]|uniref:Septum formation initiator family protein n=1 Tax=Arthrobacter echini TaxID=1529066 RepID=A0A4S5E8Q5_9MICC|nr:septum formation initiator family protein [Arthrobacter echini]THJ67910.1 septum formation initiator family protein [Arthrobacter echini]